MQASLTVTSSGSRYRYHGIYSSRLELHVGRVQEAHRAHRCVTTYHCHSLRINLGWQSLIARACGAARVSAAAAAAEVRCSSGAQPCSSEGMALAAKLMLGVLRLSCCTATAEPGGQPHCSSGHAPAQPAFRSRHLLWWQAVARQSGTEGRLPAMTFISCKAKMAWTMCPLTSSM